MLFKKKFHDYVSINQHVTRIFSCFIAIKLHDKIPLFTAKYISCLVKENSIGAWF